jgi:hypothetical protein
MEWLEGMAILSAVFVVVAVTSVNNYEKEKQFRALSAVNDDVTITIIRKGEKARISTYEIVVRVCVHTYLCVCTHKHTHTQKARHIVAHTQTNPKP